MIATNYVFFLVLSFCFHVAYTIDDSANLRKLVSPAAASRSPIPLEVSGECTAGTVYTINSIDDLFRNMKNLECIFAAGKTPGEGQVPLGYSYGYMLSALNTAFWDRFVELVYQGDYVVATQCKGNPYNIGWMSIGGFKLGTAVWSIGKFPAAGNLAQGEYPLGEATGIIMDFTPDFRKLCPVEGNESPFGLQGFSPFRNSIWPVRNFIDIGRVVGRDVSDGAIITLNKAFLLGSDNRAMTVMFYATKNFDSKVMPDFARSSSQPIVVPKGPNGETVIKYSRGGAEAFFNGLNPFGFLKGDQGQQRVMNFISNLILEDLKFFV